MSLPAEPKTSFLEWAKQRYPQWERLHAFIELKALSGYRSEDMIELRSDQLMNGWVLLTAQKPGIPFLVPPDLLANLKRLAGDVYLWEGFLKDAAKYRTRRDQTTETFNPVTVSHMMDDLYREYRQTHRAEMDDRSRSGSTPKMPRKTVIGLVVGIGLLFSCCGGLFIVGLWSQKQDAEEKRLAEAKRAEVQRLADAKTQEELALGDVLWAKGDKAGAVQKYRGIFDDRRDQYTKPQDLARIYGRRIDHAYQTGNPQEGKTLIDAADQKGVAPEVNHADAKEATVAMKAEKARVAAEKVEQKRLDEAKKAEEQRLADAKNAEDKRRAEEKLWVQVRGIKIKIAEQAAQYWEFSKWASEANTVVVLRVVAKCVAVPPKDLPNELYIVFYDEDDVNLGSVSLRLNIPRKLGDKAELTILGPTGKPPVRALVQIIKD